MGRKKLEKHQNESFALAWWEFVLKFQMALFRYALYLTKGDKDAAEDLNHGAICKFIENPPDPNEVNNPAAYLKRVLYNFFVDEQKKKKAYVMESLDDEENPIASSKNFPSISPTAQRNLENEELKKALEISMYNLKPEESDVFRLFLEGNDCEEIATILNINIFRVRYVLNATRAKIRYRLDKQTKAAKP